MCFCFCFTLNTSEKGSNLYNYNSQNSRLFISFKFGGNFFWVKLFSAVFSSPYSPGCTNLMSRYVCHKKEKALRNRQNAFSLSHDTRIKFPFISSCLGFFSVSGKKSLKSFTLTHNTRKIIFLFSNDLSWCLHKAACVKQKISRKIPHSLFLFDKLFFFRYHKKRIYFLYIRFLLCSYYVEFINIDEHIKIFFLSLLMYFSFPHPKGKIYEFLCLFFDDSNLCCHTLDVSNAEFISSYITFQDIYSSIDHFYFTSELNFKYLPSNLFCESLSVFICQFADVYCLFAVA